MGTASPQPITPSWPVEVHPEALLVARAQVNHAAFAPLYNRYFEPIFRFCYYRLGDWQEAEDAASDVFTKALGNLDRFHTGDQEDGFRCWLFAIARHVVTDRHREQVRHPTAPLDAASSAAAGGPTPEEAAVTADNHRHLRSLLARLKPHQRDLLELRLAGLKNAEIARILGRSHAAVRKEQSRIVHLLRGFVDLDPEKEAAHG